MSPTTPAIPLTPSMSVTPPKGGEMVKVRELAHEFESMLLLQMIRQMRQSMAKSGDSDEESNGFGLGNEAMTDTVDSELARQLSLSGGVGVADVIVDGFVSKHLVQGTDGDAATKAVAPPGGLSFGLAPSHPRTSAPAQLDDARPHLMSAPPHLDLPVSENRPVVPVDRPAVSAVAASNQAAVPLPVAAPLTSHFGWRADPLDGHVRFHRGVDVRAAYGTEVPAAAQGSVVFAGEQGGYGTTVVVAHPQGLRTRYAHLSASLVRVGDQVAAGQPIGRVGSSGRSTGAHLHFEVEQDGRRIDPEMAAARFAALDGFKARAGSADSPTGGDPLPATEE